MEAECNRSKTKDVGIRKEIKSWIFKPTKKETWISILRQCLFFCFYVIVYVITLTGKLYFLFMFLSEKKVHFWILWQNVRFPESYC